MSPSKSKTGKNGIPDAIERGVLVNLADLIEDPRNARQTYSTEVLANLGASLQERQLHNLVLQRVGKELHVVCGHLRKRSGQHVGLKQLRADIFEDLTSAQVFLLQARENLNREQLTLYEEATVYQRAEQELGLSRMQVAETFRVAYNTVKNRMAILAFPEEVSPNVERGGFSQAHAKALLPLAAQPKLLTAALKAIGVGTKAGVTLTVPEMGAEVARSLRTKGLAKDVEEILPNSFPDRHNYGTYDKFLGHGVIELQDDFDGSTYLVVDEEKADKRVKELMTKRREQKAATSKSNEKWKKQLAKDAERREAVEALQRRETMAAALKQLRTAPLEDLVDVDLVDVQWHNLDEARIKVAFAAAKLTGPNVDELARHERSRHHGLVRDALAKLPIEARVRVAAALRVVSHLSDKYTYGKYGDYVQAITGQATSHWHALAEDALKEAKAGKPKRTSKADELVVDAALGLPVPADTVPAEIVPLRPAGIPLSELRELVALARADGPTLRVTKTVGPVAMLQTTAPESAAPAPATAAVVPPANAAAAAMEANLAARPRKVGKWQLQAQEDLAKRPSNQPAMPKPAEKTGDQASNATDELVRLRRARKEATA
jgi:ParB/RepB/Spo0J family partition protein